MSKKYMTHGNGQLKSEENLEYWLLTLMVETKDKKHFLIAPLH
jgi:hypothetical protein